MTDYAIAFDLPEFDGDPWFASLDRDAKLDRDAPGLTSSLAAAATFPTMLAAERFLTHFYSAGTRQYGVVVEVVA